ncbi:MAG: hypothetical protein RJA70_1193 [Pseudomonadota bacterium]|jgi:MoxR-like ATPase
MVPGNQNVESRLQLARKQSQALRAALGQVVVGQQGVVEQVLWCLLAQGHVLLEGAPGLGKTLLVRTLSQCLDLTFSRIQFTPDLMPSDITGNNMLRLDTQGRTGGGFELHRGPVFTQLLLADEINRATPKTQSALLEAMQERAVTISGIRHPLPEPFMVLGTQNPIEMEGTYALPEAQLDRFLLMVVVQSPDTEQMLQILERTTGQPSPDPSAVLSCADLLELQRLCRDIVVARPVMHYAARLVAATSPGAAGAPPVVQKAVQYGASVRAAQAMVLAAKARALLDGRANVAFEDVREVAAPALRHRLILSFEGEADGLTTDDVVHEVLAGVGEHPEAVARELRG